MLPLTSGGSSFTVALASAPIASRLGLVAILRAMEYGDNRDLVSRLDDFVDDDIREPDYDPFVRSPRPAIMTDIRQYSEAIGCVPNPGGNLGCRLRIVPLNVIVNVFDVALCSPSKANLHSPHFFQSAAISSSVA